MTFRTFAAVASLTLIAAACQPPDDQETGSISRDEVRETRELLDPAVAAAIDSGNAAYREENFQQALDHYRAAIEQDDEVAAAWFGVYMAELALGNADAADQAMERARDLAPGASLIHPEAAEDTP